jgi:CelD/BcsL family acetyltransferase involved in cellulose biosynthesis
MSISVQIVQNSESLEQYRAHWDALVASCPTAAPTQTYAWISSFLAHDLPSGCPWLCLFAFEGSQLVGLGLLIRESKRNLGPFKIYRFRNLYSAFHTNLVDALVMPGHEHALSAMYHALKHHFRAFPIIAFKAIQSDGSTLSAAKSATNKGLRITIPAHYHEDVIPIVGSAEQYIAALKSKFRREILRQERNMGTKGLVGYSIGSNPEIEDPLALFLALENSGWKGVEGTSILAHHHDAKLFTEAVQEFAKNSMLHWAFLHIGETTVAGQLGVAVNGILYLWKVGYLEDYSTMGPGNVLLYRVLEHLHRTQQYHQVSFMNERSWLSPFQPTKHPLVDCTIMASIPGLAASRKLASLLKSKHTSSV